MILISFFTLELSTRLFCRYFLIFDIEMLRYSTQLKDYSSTDLLSFEHIKNSQATLMGVNVKINGQGLRDQDKVPDPSQNNIAFLGDSLTFGWGVEKSKTFEEIVEKMMNNSEKKINIINYAHCNYNSEQEVDFFLKRADLNSLSSVALFYFINDAEITPSKTPPPFYSKSLFISLARSRYQMLVNSKNYLTYYSELYQEQSPGWIRAQNSIQLLKQKLTQRNISLQVFLLPELHQLTPYPFTEVHRKITTFLDQEKIPWSDLTENFKGYKKPQDLWVAPDDAHPNERAHKIIADAIFHKLKVNTSEPR
jgi:lysophospholipase L1-like esterase